MIRGRQPATLPLAFDPEMDAAECVYTDGRRCSRDDIFAAYLKRGPAAPPVRQPDGSGELLVEVDDGTVKIAVPADTIWVELSTTWSADDEDDLAVDVGPADPLGGILAQQLAAGAELTRRLREGVQQELEEWLAAHRIELGFSDQVTADTDDAEDAVRRESALVELATRLKRHIDAPGVAGRVQQARAAVADLDHPIRQTVEGICDDLDRLRPRVEHDFAADEQRAFRQKRQRDRRLRRLMAQRVVRRFVGWDEAPDEHWRVFETEVSPHLQLQLIDEICTHAARIATALPPKRSRASSRASG